MLLVKEENNMREKVMWLMVLVAVPFLALFITPVAVLVESRDRQFKR